MSATLKEIREAVNSPGYFIDSSPSGLLAAWCRQLLKLVDEYEAASSRPVNAVAIDNLAWGDVVQCIRHPDGCWYVQKGIAR